MTLEYTESSLTRYKKLFKIVDYNNTELCCGIQEKKKKVHNSKYQFLLDKI